MVGKRRMVRRYSRVSCSYSLAMDSDGMVTGSHFAVVSGFYGHRCPDPLEYSELLSCPMTVHKAHTHDLRLKSFSGVVFIEFQSNRLYKPTIRQARYLTWVNRFTLSSEALRDFPGSDFSLDQATIWCRSKAEAELQEVVPSHFPRAGHQILRD